MDRSLLPRPEDVVVDKVNNEWVFEYSVNAQTTLQLRVQHWNVDNLNDAICEIREGSDQLFREVGRPTFAPIEFDPDCWNEEPALSEWPTEWRAEFVKLARVWSALTALAEWGVALGDRQAEWEAQWSSSETTAAEPPEGGQ
jgi:hypothetical protein